jgi:WD40 repeat protein
MVPGARPYEALETALLRIATNPPAALLDQLRDGDRGIHRAVSRIVPDDGGTVLVVIDQFEELFTATGDAERRGFLRALAAAVTEPAGPLRVVATMRADFYDQPLRHPEFALLFKHSTVAITPLAPDELETAITAPAAAAGVGFEPGLVAEIVADVNSQPGGLPLLQYALTQTFDVTDGDTITSDGYHDIGGLTGAVARRADRLYDESSDDERRALRRVLGRLVTLGEGTDDTRRRVRSSELATDDATRRVIARFGDARLLTFDHDPATREPTVEIAHEALIREWPRLSAWLDEDRDGLRIHRHLTETTAAWIAADRDDGELYRGARLDAATSWAGDHDGDLNRDEHEFLAASIAAHEAEEAAEQERFDEQVRANRRLRALVAAAVVIALIAAGVGIFALQQRSRADEQADEALAQAAAANDARLDAEAAEAEAVDASVDAAAARIRAQDNSFEAQQQAAAARAAEEQGDLERIRAVARATAAQDPSVAALLAVEAYHRQPSVDSLDTLHRVLTEMPGYHGSIGVTPYVDMVSIDDTTVAAANGTRVDIWDVTARALVRSIPHAGVGGLEIMTRLGDDRLAIVDEGRRSTTIFELSSGAVVGTIEHGAAVGDIAATADGDRLAAGLVGGDVEVWTLGSEAPDRIVDTGDVDVSFVRWHPDGEQLAAVLGNAVVQLWDPDAEAPIWATEPPQAGIVNQLNPFAAAFDPDGARFAFVAGSLGPSLRVIDVGTGLEAGEPVSLPILRNFTLDDLEWRGGDTVVVPTRGSVVAVDVGTGDVTTELDRFIRSGFAVQYSPALGQYVVAGLSGLEFWSTDPSGPLERVVPLTAAQMAGLQAVGGPILAALSGDGMRLLVSVFKVPPPLPPTTVIDLSGRGADPTVDDDLGVVIGFGDLTLTARNDFTIQLLDRDLDPIGPRVPLPFDYSELGVSEDGRFLALGRQGGLADVRRISDGELIETISLGDADEFAGALVAPWFTSDGEFMSLITTDGRSGIWRTGPLERLDVPEGLSNRIVVALGDWLFAQEGSAFQRWDPETLQPVGVPIPLAGLGGLGYAQFDRSHQRIVAGGAEVAKLFDLETGSQLGRDLPYAGSSNRMQFTADGSLLAVPADGAVHLWNFDTDSWADIACRFAGRNLTPEEWNEFGPRTIDYRATCDQYPIEP